MLTIDKQLLLRYNRGMRRAKSTLILEITVAVLVLLTLSVLILFLNVKKPVQATQIKPLSASDVSPYELYNLINQDRTNAGVPALMWDDNLVKSASDKCSDMATKDYYAHSDPNGAIWTNILKKYVPYYNAADENIDVNLTDKSAADIESIFMNSPVHRTATLNAQYTNVGIASCNGKYQGQDAVYVVEHFIQPITPQPQHVSTIPDGRHIPGTNILLPPCTEAGQLPGLDCI